MSRRTGLGRGLSALMDEVGEGGDPAVPAATPVSIPVASISAHPRQPRRRFDADAMDELIASVRERGVLQPILVRPLGSDRYQIVAGERRWRAAQTAGLHEMPVVVRDLDERAAFEIALIENIQRADLNAIEEAESYARLIRDYGHTQDIVAKAVGKARSHIANLLRLLDLPEGVRAMVSDGRLSMGHARGLAASADPQALAERAVAGGWSVRQVEAAARKPVAVALAQAGGRHTVGGDDASLTALEGQLSEALGSRVTVDTTTASSGTVTIAYASLDQLDVICQRLGGGSRF